MASGNVYVVKTNLPPQELTRVGLEVFKLWVDFALGKESIGGHRIVYPSGRYASSISFEQEGVSSVAIIADESVAPEARYLESGHGRVDLKTRLQMGRVYPMHRRVGGTPGTSLLRIGPQAAVPMKYGAKGRFYAGTGKVGVAPKGRYARPSIWAEVKSSTSSGFASIGPNSPPDSWIIPPMPAYAPAANLARMVAGMR